MLLLEEVPLVGFSLERLYQLYETCGQFLLNRLLLQRRPYDEYVVFYDQKTLALQFYRGHILLYPVKENRKTVDKLTD